MPDAAAMALTKRHIPSGGRILEGGCGLAGGVMALQAAGYDAYGVDYASETVDWVRRTFPDLRVSLGDVRCLDFPDESFDGYWSIGVIEHFYEGYRAILAEIHRVLRPEGMLVLTFPHRSPLRGFKAARGGYPPLPEAFDPDREGFYQFLLDAGQVRQDLVEFGFDILEARRDSGLKGLKDECPAALASSLNALYRAASLPARLAKAIVDFALRPLCGHVMALVARKRNDASAVGARGAGS